MKGIDFLFPLLQLALGGIDRLPEVPTEDDWKEVLGVAHRQYVLPMVAAGMERMTDIGQDVNLPKEVILKVMNVLLSQEKQNARQDRCAAQLTSELAADGFRSCILKGQGVGLLYEHPERRQCGDIDIWVEGGISKVVPYVRGKWNAGKATYHHIDATVFNDMSVEIHYRPAWLYNPVSNRKLQDYFESRAEEQFARLDEALGFAYPDVEFNLVFCAIHILEHMLNEKVSLKQMLDYHHIMVAATPQDRQRALKVLDSMRLHKLAAALTWACAEMFATQAEHYLCEPDAKEGRKLVEDIISRSSRKRNGYLKYFSSYPSQALWAPLWKVWHFFWRQTKKAL